MELSFHVFILTFHFLCFLPLSILFACTTNYSTVCPRRCAYSRLEIAVAIQYELKKSNLLHNNYEAFILRLTVFRLTDENQMTTPFLKRDIHLSYTFINFNCFIPYSWVQVFTEDEVIGGSKGGSKIDSVLKRSAL